MESADFDSGGKSVAEQVEQRVDWYVPKWLSSAELPFFEVIDTRSAQGRLDLRSKIVTIRDLVLFHGHACDGLLRGMWAMRALADFALPDQPFDRSDLMVVSKNSPCLGDIAVYLTGGRARFGTHRLDNDLGVGFQLVKISTGEIWEVREEAGFFSPQIARWEAKLLTAEISLEEKAEILAVHEAAQWDWVRQVLLASRPQDHYVVKRLDSLELPPPLYVAPRTDTVNRAIEAPKEVATRYEPDLDQESPLTPTSSLWNERYLSGN